MEAPQDDVAERDLVAVLERVVRVLGAGGGVDETGRPCSSASRPCPGDVVGMRVRLEHADDPHPALLRLLEVLLDREGRVDDDGRARVLVADEVRRAPEILVDELREDHSARR